MAHNNYLADAWLSLLSRLRLCLRADCDLVVAPNAHRHTDEENKYCEVTGLGEQLLRLGPHCTREWGSVVAIEATATVCYQDWTIFVLGPGVRVRFPNFKPLCHSPSHWGVKDKYLIYLHWSLRFQCRNQNIEIVVINGTGRSCKADCMTVFVVSTNKIYLELPTLSASPEPQIWMRDHCHHIENIITSNALLKLSSVKLPLSVHQCSCRSLSFVAVNQQVETKYVRSWKKTRNSICMLLSRSNPYLFFIIRIYPQARRESH